MVPYFSFFRRTFAFYGLMIGIIVCVSIIELLYPGSMNYNRELVSGGEYWRIFLCNYVHLGIGHLAVNMVLFGAFPFLFLITNKILFISILVISFFVGFGLHFFSLNIVSYVGFSGVWYGVAALGLLLEIQRRKRKDSLFELIVLVGILGKIVYEQLPGYNIMVMEKWIDGAVVVDSHLYGFTGGVLLFFLMVVYQTVSTRWLI